MSLQKVGEHEVTSDFSGDVDVNIGGDVSSSDTVTLSASNTQNISSDTTVSLSDNGSLSKTVTASKTVDEVAELTNRRTGDVTAVYNYSFTMTKIVVTEFENYADSTTNIRVKFIDLSGFQYFEFQMAYNPSTSAPVAFDVGEIETDMPSSPSSNANAQGYVKSLAGKYVDIYKETVTADASIS